MRVLSRLPGVGSKSVSKSNDKTIVHFIHPGKTGGYLVKSILSNCKSNEYEFVLHGIDVKLKDIPIGEKVILFTRNHLERFCRGFINRKNKGAPFYSTDWNNSEKEVFSQYLDPNQLAESLSSDDLNERSDAFRAMGMVRFIDSPLFQHFGNVDDLKERESDIVFMGSADDFLLSLTAMLDRFNLDKSLLGQVDQNAVSYFSEKYM